MADSYRLPENPGDPASTDNEGIFPDDVENLVEEAARTQGGDEDDDLLTTQPDPVVDAREEDWDPTREDDLDGDIAAVLDDIEAEIGTADAPEASTDINTIEAQLAERTEDLQRVTAEYANYRRRTERDRVGIIDTAKAGVVGQLLPILDDLDLAQQHGDLTEGPLKTFADKFQSTLTGLKLEAFGETGELFDPEIHEAVQDLSQGDTKVLGTVLRKGYRFNGKLIRNAMVIIAEPEQ